LCQRPNHTGCCYMILTVDIRLNNRDGSMTQ
jgi:hypothetical protein